MLKRLTNPDAAEGFVIDLSVCDVSDLSDVIVTCYFSQKIFLFDNFYKFGIFHRNGSQCGKC